MNAFTVSITTVLFNQRPDPSREPQAYWQWRLTVGALAQMFARQNPRFDIERFIRTCGAPASE